MYFLIPLLFYLKGWMTISFQLLKFRFISSSEKDLEILALRSQLALYEGQVISKKRPKPKPTTLFKQTWIFISKFLSSWREILSVVKPETVVRWHRLKFAEFWTKKSKRIGRPPIYSEVVKLVQKIYSENFNISPEKIHEQLILLGLKNPPAHNTIAKYIKDISKPPTRKQIENWHIFFKNHMDVTLATDFLLFLLSGLKYYMY